MAEKVIEAQVRAMVAQLYEKEQASKKSPFPEWLVTTLQGITLATIVGCAFWLGSLSSTVSRSAEKLDRLSDAVMNPSRDGMANRLSVIETKLDTINEKARKGRAATKEPLMSARAGQSTIRLAAARWACEVTRLGVEGPLVHRRAAVKVKTRIAQRINSPK